jgi:hypothetical protein
MANPSALERVMSQAEDASANFQAPALQTPSNVPAVSNESSRPTLDSIADSAGIQVDEYLTVKDSGFRLGDAKAKMFTEATVRIDLSEVQPILSVRANRAGQTTFIKSYDGRMTSQGQNFEQATAQLRAQNDKVDGPYQTVEIPAELLADAGGVSEGQRIGITPAITGVKFWTKFYNELRKKGLQNSTVDVTIRHKGQVNSKGNEWGVVEFVLIGEATS